LSRKIKLVELDLVTHCHATEDPEKVKKAILNVLPPELRSAVNVSEVVLEGYYGNPIIRMGVVLRGEDAEKAFKYVIRSLSEGDRGYLLLSLEQRYDRKSNKLYLRLDKQEAYLGRLVLNDGSDTIRISASFSIVRSLDEVRKYIEEILRESS